jgi:hypothetical protein
MEFVKQGIYSDGTKSCQRHGHDGGSQKSRGRR